MVEREPQWPASVALLVGIGLLVSLPQRIEIGALRWIVPGIEGVCRTASAAVCATSRSRSSRCSRSPTSCR